MKNIHLTLLIALVTFTYGYCQKSDLSIYKNLVGKTWKFEGNWGNGTKFKQEVSFEYSLKDSIVIVKTKGYTNKTQTEYGDRNFGIRKYDSTSGKVKFWEYDVFGGLTEGWVFAEGNNIVQQYKYGNSILTDMWEYVNDTTYNLKIGIYEKGVWKQIYLSTTIELTIGKK